MPGLRDTSGSRVWEYRHLPSSALPDFQWWAGSMVLIGLVHLETMLVPMAH